MDNKIILAYCTKFEKKFCIEVKQRLSRYEAVNFVDLSDTEYASLSSDFLCDNLRSAENLISCRYCRSRQVSGCSCNRRHKQCKPKGKYDFQCLYCDCLTLNPPKSASRKIYVTEEYFDDIGEVLDSMNLKYEHFHGDFDCDILFINCGTEDKIDSQKLASFVKNGGCLYASDWAGMHIEAAFPGIITFKKDGKKCKVFADVVDSELLQIIGKKIQIEFDLANWYVLDKIKGKVLLQVSQGEIYAGCPVMISFSYGKGVVFYTSFHNHQQASEKEKMLLQLLLLKQIGAVSNQSIEQVGALIGLNIASLKDRFKK